VTRALASLAVLLVACAGTPLGVRPSRVSIHYNATDDPFNGAAVGNGAGVEVEFEFVYPDEPPSEEDPAPRRGPR